jgi:hypothetical protein
LENNKMKLQADVTDLRTAVAPNTGPVGGLTGIAIDGGSFRRARFIFNFAANAGTTAALSAGLGVWNAATSGSTFTQVGSLAAVTSGVLGSNIMVVDVPVSSASPWMKVSGGSILSTAISNSCVVELYQSISRPPTPTPQQIVTI